MSFWNFANVAIFFFICYGIIIETKTKYTREKKMTCCEYETHTGHFNENRSGVSRLFHRFSLILNTVPNEPLAWSIDDRTTVHTTVKIVARTTYILWVVHYIHFRADIGQEFQITQFVFFYIFNSYAEDSCQKIKLKRVSTLSQWKPKKKKKHKPKHSKWIGNLCRTRVIYIKKNIQMYARAYN